MLLAATAAALLWCNLWPSGHYESWWNHSLALGLSVRQWVNDALMALFFLIVGLEIEREFLDGSLQNARAAALPIAAAIGGMIVPAAFYLAFAGRSAFAIGWGVPMATDIAFALGLLGLLAPGVPPAVRAFLAALAIVDDLGAILVIAIAYAGAPNWLALGVAVACVAALFGMRRAGVSAVWPYLAVGVPLWIALHAGGIHPSLTGVVVAFALPTASAARSPDLPNASLRVEHALHTWVAVGVLPLFALANAGVELQRIAWSEPIVPAMLGVMAGLVVGKPLGIVGASWLAVRSGLAALPTGLTWSRVAIVGAFGGIGFTMAIFVTSLAFADPLHAERVKSAVLAASVVAAILGAILVRATERR